MPPVTGDYRLVSPGQVLRREFDRPVRVHGFTDIHHGAVEHHYDKFDEAIKVVKDDPDAYWFGNGDLIELIPPNYKISQRGQNMEPDDQFLTFMERIEPIADRCLFLRGGNHDTIRSTRILGFDAVKVLSERLDIPYYELPGYTVINIDGTDWSLASGHGKSAAQNGDLDLHRLRAVYSDGDIFYLGHNHQLYAKPVDSLKIDGHEERIHRQWYIRGGSFLKYADYSRYAMYPLIRTGWVTMEFHPDNTRVWVN